MFPCVYSIMHTELRYDIQSVRMYPFVLHGHFDCIRYSGSIVRSFLFLLQDCICDGVITGLVKVTDVVMLIECCGVLASFSVEWMSNFTAVVCVFYWLRPFGPVDGRIS